MSDKFDLVRGWLVKAHSDLTTGNLVAGGDGPYDTACFHAQQAIEKAFKALLPCMSNPFPAPMTWRNCNIFACRSLRCRSWPNST
jgi:hypothetical protein